MVRLPKSDEFSRLIGLRVKEFRKKRGLTQAQLAREIGISQGALGHIEAGTRTPKVSTLIDIGRALDTSPAVFFMTDTVYVFDMEKLTTKYDSRDKLTTGLYRNINEIVLYAKKLGLG